VISPILERFSATRLDSHRASIYAATEATLLRRRRCTPRGSAKCGRGIDSPGCHLAPLPDWVLQLAADQPRRLGHSIAYWRRLVREGVRAGERNNTVASLAGHLLRHGVDASVAMEVLLCWNRVRCRPSLMDDEVVSVVESIGRLRACERPRMHRR